MKYFALSSLLFALAFPNLATMQERNRPVYQHAYYLFLADAPKGCEDCYIPLLITQTALEELQQVEVIGDAVLIITYERDSIWEIEPPMTIGRADINLAARKIRLKDRSYRYQEITPAEVVKLLENPTGRIPISRPTAPPSQNSLADILSDFKSAR